MIFKPCSNEIPHLALCQYPQNHLIQSRFLSLHLHLFASFFQIIHKSLELSLFSFLLSCPSCQQPCLIFSFFLLYSLLPLSNGFFQWQNLSSQRLLALSTLVFSYFLLPLLTCFEPGYLLAKLFFFFLLKIPAFLFFLFLL